MSIESLTYVELGERLGASAEAAWSLARPDGRQPKSCACLSDNNWGVFMGAKLTATLYVTFEMEDGAPDDLALTRLKTSVAEMQRLIESGVTGSAKTLVKRGAARVVLLNHKVDP
jgi:hypothetical protein